MDQKVPNFEHSPSQEMDCIDDAQQNQLIPKQNFPKSVLVLKMFKAILFQKFTIVCKYKKIRSGLIWVWLEDELAIFIFLWWKHRMGESVPFRAQMKTNKITYKSGCNLQQPLSLVALQTEVI